MNMTLLKNYNYPGYSSLSVLLDVLNEKLKNHIPVISVISIMGTTEESAVDPLDEILKIRDQLKKRVRQSFFNICSNNVINFSLSFIWSK